MTTVTATRRVPLVPFVSTGPLDDLRWGLMLLPVWWVVGAEQFALPLVAVLAAVKLSLTGRMRRHPVVGLFLVYLAVQLLSALFIIEGERYVWFARTFLVHLSALAALVVVVTTVASRRQVERLVASLTVALSWSGVAGLLGILGVARPRFSSLVGAALPEAISSTGYGQQIALRQTGNTAWFSVFGEYFRVDGFFLFSTTYAAALVVAIPLVVWLVRTTAAHRRLVPLLAAGLLAVNLLFTTGRGAILSFVGALAVFFVSGRRRLVQVLAVATLTTAVAIGTLLVPQERLAETFSSAALARGSGSYQSRMTIYRYTLMGIVERPLLGWGTERDITDIDGFPLPAGSHSGWLSVPYRHGLVGAALYLAMLVLAWRSTAHRQGAPRWLTELRTHLRWGLVAGVGVGAVTVLNIDSVTFIAFWLVIGLGCATGSGALARAGATAAPPLSRADAAPVTT